MKTKSLRQVARELGVFASYLSQVKNGVRPPSDKVLSNPNVKRLLRMSTHETVKQIRSGLGRFRTYDQSVMSRPLCP